MAESLTSLAEALGLEAREHVALVGAGGKTSLLFALAGELLRAGKKVLTSTTTKVWHHQALQAPSILFVHSEPSWRERLKEGLQKEGHLFLGEKVLDSGKVRGVAPSVLDGLYQETYPDCLVVEADGSAGHPVKAPARHEPVIPSSATMVVAMMGLEAIGKRCGPEVVFRQEEFTRITGLDPGERLTVSALSRLFLEPEGLLSGAPIGARKVAFLNKADLANEQEAQALARFILGDERKVVHHVVIGSVMRGLYTRLSRS